MRPSTVRAAGRFFDDCSAGAFFDGRDRVALGAARALRRHLGDGVLDQDLRQATQDEATAERVGDLAIRGARPLRQNAYKIPLMRNLVKRSVRAAEAKRLARQREIIAESAKVGADAAAVPNANFPPTPSL